MTAKSQDVSHRLRCAVTIEACTKIFQNNAILDGGEKEVIHGARPEGIQEGGGRIASVVQVVRTDGTLLHHGAIVH